MIKQCENCEKLVKERDALLRDAEVHDTPAWIANEQLNERVDRLADERDAAHARAERLEAVLKPFAIAADDLDDPCWRDDSHCWESPAAMSVTAGDFRRARAALAPEPPT